VAEHEIIAEVLTGLARRGIVRFVKAEGHAEFF
jgi:hypothetical protein